MSRISIYIYLVAVFSGIFTIFRTVNTKKRALSHEGIRSFIYAVAFFSLMGITNFMVSYSIEINIIRYMHYPENVVTLLYALYTVFAALYYVFLLQTCLVITGRKTPVKFMIVFLAVQAVLLTLSIVIIKYPGRLTAVEAFISIRKLDLYSRMFITGLYIYTLVSSGRITEPTSRRAVRIFLIIFIVLEAGNFLHHDMFPDWYIGEVRAITNSLSYFVPMLIISLGINPFIKLYFSGQPDNPLHLSERERLIIEGVCSGKSNKEIAFELAISLSNVKYHTHVIYKKFNVTNRVELCNLMKENSLRA